jgi:hypothetical protein
LVFSSGYSLLQSEIFWFMYHGKSRHSLWKSFGKNLFSWPISNCPHESTQKLWCDSRYLCTKENEQRIHSSLIFLIFFRYSRHFAISIHFSSFIISHYNFIHACLISNNTKQLFMCIKFIICSFSLKNICSKLLPNFNWFVGFLILSWDLYVLWIQVLNHEL